LINGLKAKLAGHPLVREVRGRGLLVGIELGPAGGGLLNTLAPGVVSAVSERVFGQWAALRLLEKNIICQPASHRWDVLRLEPPLTIQPAEIDQLINAVAGVLEGYTQLGPLLKDVAERLGEQSKRGWTFP
jgi:putrescine aminotransferase